jgi:hypothetical protein
LCYCCLICTLCRAPEIDHRQPPSADDKMSALDAAVHVYALSNALTALQQTTGAVAATAREKADELISSLCGVLDARDRASRLPGMHRELRKQRQADVAAAREVLRALGRNKPPQVAPQQAGLDPSVAWEIQLDDKPIAHGIFHGEQSRTPSEPASDQPARSALEPAGSESGALGAGALRI